jgi:hypothetical protein
MKKLKRAAEEAPSLTKDDRMLVVLRDELYGGSWKEMLSDLRARLKNKPFVFKLAHRIEADISRIEKLMTYESRSSVNLSDLIRTGGRA